MDGAPIVFGELTESYNNDPQLKQVEWSYPISAFAFYFNTTPPKASPPFTFGNTSLHFLIYPGDLISLCSSEETPFPHPIEYSFSVKTPGGELIGTKTFVSTIGRTTKDGCVYSVEEALLEFSNRILRTFYEILRTGIYVIVCQLRIKSEAIKTGNLNVESNSTPLVHWRLAGDSNYFKELQEMLLSGKYSDFVFNVKGKEFRVHRNILAARSPVFAAMFDLDMKEKKENNADIEDCEPDIFSNFLNLLYAGEIENFNSDHALDLYEVADKYQVTEVNRLCMKYMMNNISVENVLDILALGLRHHVKELIDAATRFFLQNSKEIAVTAKWITFLKINPIAANELFLKTLELKK